MNQVGYAQRVCFRSQPLRPLNWEVMTEYPNRFLDFLEIRNRSEIVSKLEFKGIGTMSLCFRSSLGQIPRRSIG
jgi:hypothetical protein